MGHEPEKFAMYKDMTDELKQEVRSVWDITRKLDFMNETVLTTTSFRKRAGEEGVTSFHLPGKMCTHTPSRQVVCKVLSLLTLFQTTTLSK
jgi:hypothetical protein